jgi:hypothetical protein
MWVSDFVPNERKNPVILPTAVSGAEGKRNMLESI